MDSLAKELETAARFWDQGTERPILQPLEKEAHTHSRRSGQRYQRYRFLRRSGVFGNCRRRLLLAPPLLSFQPHSVVLRALTNVLFSSIAP